MVKHQGFTLIELVAVIVILGILTAIAVPKFVNLQGDARFSALSGLKGSIQSANTLIYSKAVISGQEKAFKTDVLIVSAANPANNIYVTTAYGYIRPNFNDFEAALGISISKGSGPSDPLVAKDWVFSKPNSVAYFWQKGAPQACFLSYEQATATTLPIITLPNPSDC